MKFLKTITIMLAFAMLVSGASFANETVTEEAPVKNGGVVESVSVIDIEGIKMIPLRQVAEELGYEVLWNDESHSIELCKGAHYITMAIGKDEYAFSRRAPQALGAAPYLYNDSVTYVPLNFVSEIIDGYYSINEDGTYKVVVPTIVTVSSINEKSILVTDSVTNQDVVVFVTEETEITDGESVKSYADIKKDMVLGVEYSPAMTASLPPQTTAVKIIIENVSVEVPADELVGRKFSGVITEIEGNKVVLGNPITDDDSIAIIVSEDTIIKKGLDKRIYVLDDLTIGMKISGTISEAATMSIPPQSVAFTINIEQ